MGKKYIITESQERILSRLVERGLGPEESVFVVNKNPFKGEEYRSARRLYSKYLSTGDLYYILDTGGACKFINNKNLETAKKVIPSIDGKTLRANDKVYTIGKVYIGMKSNGDIIVQVDLKDSSSEDFKTFTGNLTTSGDVGSTLEYMAPSFERLYVGASGENTVLIPLRRAHGSDIPVLRNDFCRSKSEEGLENVPDEFFEIRRIERLKTDL